jgi:hypothetical protein
MMREIYEVLISDGLRVRDIRTAFQEAWFRHSIADKKEGDSQTH